jgi:hypothetical protein
MCNSSGSPFPGGESGESNKNGNMVPDLSVIPQADICDPVLSHQSRAPPAFLSDRQIMLYLTLGSGQEAWAWWSGMPRKPSLMSSSHRPGGDTGSWVNSISLYFYLSVTSPPAFGGCLGLPCLVLGPASLDRMGSCPEISNQGTRPRRELRKP